MKTLALLMEGLGIPFSAGFYLPTRPNETSATNIERAIMLASTFGSEHHSNQLGL
jgi:hypothetical protein